MTEINYSVIIPVFNGAKTLEELINRTTAVFNKLDETFEIILVDDYSKDESWTLLQKLALENKQLKAVKLTNNFGQHNATLCGLKYAKGNYIVTMDDDLQHNPEDIPKLIEKMRDTKSKVVIAKLLDKKHNFYRRKASDLMRKLNEVTIEKPKGLHLSSFRLIVRPVAENMVKISSAFPYIPALLFFITKEVVNVEVQHNERKFGNSNYTLSKMIKLASQLLISNSSILMRFVGRLGLGISAISILVVVYLFLNRIIFDQPFNGLTTVIAIFLFVSGIQLIALCLVGEYLIRILHEVNKRPNYVVDELINTEEI